MQTNKCSFVNGIVDDPIVLYTQQLLSVFNYVISVLYDTGADTLHLNLLYTASMCFRRRLKHWAHIGLSLNPI